MTDRPMPDEARHYVAKGAFDPYGVDILTPEQERYYLASQWKLMWWKFKRHRIAVISGIILLIFYASILVSEVLAPYNQHTRHTDYLFVPPQAAALQDVPLVLLLAPSVAALPLADSRPTWLLLAFVSTVAGNLTLVGSVANLIVAERSKVVYELTFAEYARVGVPSTLLVLLAGIPIVVASVR